MNSDHDDKTEGEGVSVDGDDIILMIEGLKGFIALYVLAMMMLVMPRLVTIILMPLAMMMMITLMMEGPRWSH